MKYIKNISFIVVLMIVGYGLVGNIIHMISGTKTVTYNFDGKDMKEIKEMKQTLETTKKSVDSLTEGKFTSEEIETIKSDLDVVIGMMDEMNLWKLKGKKKLTINDIYVLKEEIESLPLLSVTSLAKIKTNHTKDKSYEEAITNSFTTLSSFTTKDFGTLKNSYDGKIELDVNVSISYLKYYMKTLNHLSSWVLEEGEQHA